MKTVGVLLILIILVAGLYFSGVIEVTRESEIVVLEQENILIAISEQHGLKWGNNMYTSLSELEREIKASEIELDSAAIYIVGNVDNKKVLALRDMLENIGFQSVFLKNY